MKNKNEKYADEEIIEDMIVENDEEKLISLFEIKNNNITITKEANVIFTELHSEEINFLTIFGNENSGKSFLMNLILNIESNSFAAPWRRTVHNSFKKTSTTSENIISILNSGNQYGKPLADNSNDIKEVVS
jgi:hypothetical protein